MFQTIYKEKISDVGGFFFLGIKLPHRFLWMAVFDLLSIAVILPVGDIFSCHAVDNPDFESEMVSH